MKSGSGAMSRRAVNRPWILHRMRSNRITWCSRRTEKFSLVAYGSLRVWQTKMLDPVRSLKNINVVALDQDALAALAKDLPRSLSWSVMISDGELFVTDERGQHEVPVEWLIGER